MNSKIAVAVGLAALLAAVVAFTPQASYAAEIAVAIPMNSQNLGDKAFVPNPVEANVGDSVTWTNNDVAIHTATSGDGATATTDGKFDSGILAKGKSFSFTFEQEGEYPYYCALHPGMIGTVMVTAGTPTPGPTIELDAASTTGKYVVNIDWVTFDIGTENKFTVNIMDAAGNAVPGATYDFMFYKGEQHLGDSHKEDQTTAEQSYTFQEQGSYRLVIQDINGENAESVDIAIQVTPEFPLGVFAIMAAVFGAIIFATRSKLQLPRI